MSDILKTIIPLFTSSLWKWDIQSQNNFFSYSKGTSFSSASMLSYSQSLSKHIWISGDDICSSWFINALSGNSLPKTIKPYVLRYWGHQFWYWAGQLWDGRVLNLWEIQKEKDIYTLQLKWSWPNIFSRWWDGFAVLRSSIREFVCSEAMYHLWVPTSRALCLIATWSTVIRDVMYDWNPRLEAWAIVCRVAPSFIRFWSFEILTKENKIPELKILVDYIIKLYYPHIDVKSENTYTLFLKEVADKTLDIIIDWQRVWFVHWVMNTDNMSILGLTLDYGPYGFLDNYDENWTPNTTDAEWRRYRFWNQANIGLWNIVQLANALYPLIKDIEIIKQIVSNYKIQYQEKYVSMMRRKLGFIEVQKDDEVLIKNLIELLQISEIDHTIFFRNLWKYTKNQYHTDDTLSPIIDAFYNQETKKVVTPKWKKWIEAYLQRLTKEATNDIDRKIAMDKVNPKYIWRNYIASQVIEDVEKGDTTSLETCMKLFENPYNEQPEFEKYFAKRPDWAKEKIGCSMLSCSS